MKSAHDLLRVVWEAARWQTVAAVVLSALLSLTEGVSLAALFPLIALLGDSGSAIPAGPRTQILLRALAATGLPHGAWLPALLLGLVVAVGVLAQLNGVLVALEQRVLLQVQEQLAVRTFDAILHAEWSYLARRRASELTHLLTNEVVRIGQLSANVLATIANGMVALLLLGVAAYLAPLLTLAVGFGFAILVPLQLRTRRRLATGGEDLTTRSAAVYDSASERLGHLKVIQAYGAQEVELGLFRARYGAVSRALMDNLWRKNRAARQFQLLSLAVLCGLLLLGLRVLHVPAVSLLVFLAAILRLVPRLNALQMSTHGIAVDLPSLRGLQALLAACGEHTAGVAMPAAEAGAPKLTTALTMRGVCFAYTDHPVLDGLDLDVPAGKITAIAGLSGAGKSTIADLALGLLYPDTGKLLSDGVQITLANASAWRKRVGYVSQDTLLFHDTIRMNLLWARPTATEQEVRDALEAARASFVWDMPAGLDSVVGDRGILLSHGQRQRLALARAFLLRPQLLILDEATNSLDLENEESVLRTVAGRTVLLISHRPSALRLADTIYVLDRGKVQRIGTWADVRHLVEGSGESENKAGTSADSPRH